MTGQHEQWPTAVAWYQRFRKTLAVLAALAATPGVLGVFAWAGHPVPAGVFAALTAVLGVLAGPAVVAAVPNMLTVDDLQRAATQLGYRVTDGDPAHGGIPYVQPPDLV